MPLLNSSTSTGPLVPPLPPPPDEPDFNAVGQAVVLVAHGLRNQLNTLSLYAALLQKQLETVTSDDDRELFEKLSNGIHHSAKDLSLLVRFGRPLTLTNRRAVNLLDLATSAARPVAAEICSAPTAPPIAFRCWAQAELVTEAIGYLLRAAPQPTVTVDISSDVVSESFGLIRAPRRPSRLSGLPSATAASDTSPFADFSDPDGLRLAFAAKIARAHGGYVGYDAATLWLAFPLSE